MKVPRKAQVGLWVAGAVVLVACGGSDGIIRMQTDDGSAGCVVSLREEVDGKNPEPKDFAVKSQRFCDMMTYGSRYHRDSDSADATVTLIYSIPVKITKKEADPAGKAACILTVERSSDVDTPQTYVLHTHNTKYCEREYRVDGFVTIDKSNTDEVDGFPGKAAITNKGEAVPVPD